MNDAGSDNDVLCPRLRLASLDLLIATPKDVKVSLLENGTYKYLYESLTRSHERNKTMIYGNNLFNMARTDIRTLLKPDGMAWRNHFQPHVDRIQMILRAILDPEQLEGYSLTSQQLSKWPKTVPLSRFKPELFGDLVPSFLTSAGDQKLYYMIYHIAGKKIVGEVRFRVCAPSSLLIMAW